MAKLEESLFEISSREFKTLAMMQKLVVYIRSRACNAKLTVDKKNSTVTCADTLR